MNYLPGHLAKRLTSDQADLIDVSVHRMPYDEISSEEIESIVSSLAHNTHVKSVDLSIPANDTDLSAVYDNDKHVRSDYDYLCQTLKSNSTIDTLTVHRVETNDAWLSLCQGLQFNSGISTLSLGDMTQHFSVKLDIEQCKMLSGFLSSTQTLLNFTLRNFLLCEDATREIAMGLRRNSSLRQLTLQKLESENIELILSLLSESQAPLQRLHLVDLEIDSGPTRSTHPMTGLGNSLNLTQLRVRECLLGSAELHALCQGMLNNESIRMLDLTGNDLLGESAKDLASMLSSNSTIQHLVLEENMLGSFGVSCLASGLRENSSLKRLNLRDNHIDDLSDLAYALQDSKLQALYLSENMLGNQGAGVLSEVIAHSTSLQALDIDACLISDEGIACLSDGLVSNSSLRHLDMSSNVCSIAGAESFARMLSMNTGLQRLNMSSCHMSDETVGHLMAGFKSTNSGLKDLALSFNAFGNEGAKYIADALLQNCKLESLEIQFNGFDAAGLKEIGIALRSNTMLQALYFWNGTDMRYGKEQPSLEIDFFLNLNRSGRCAITECNTKKSLWPYILERADAVYGADALFYMLRELPSIQ